MKRIAIITVMLLAGLTASAASIRYFTYPQASRTVQYLGRQQEMMIYCGYDYEIETYVLINEVWMERVNSSYYEIWVYGWDAYTGDEVYMPLDLQCVWLYSAGRMYNAAQYLRFHATVHTPAFAWYVPPYNPFTPRPHALGYVHSYHYDIHRHGWMPPAPPHHGYGPGTQPPLPPYYMRHHNDPAPAPTNRWTPGVDHPQVSNGNSSRGHNSIPTTRPADGGSGNSNSGSTTRGTGTTTRGSGNDTGTTTRGTGTTTRSSSNDSGSTTRGTGTTTRSTGTTPTRSNTGTATRSSETDNTGNATTRSSNTGTTTRSSNSGTTTRSSNSGTTTRSSNSGTTIRSSNSGTTTRRSSTGTTTRSSNTGTTTRGSNTTRTR